MSTRVFTTLWRLSSGLRRPIHLWSSKLSTTSASIFEPIPREELVTKFKSRLRGRKFLPGSSRAVFPEFLAEPRDSFPLGVRVKNGNQASLSELAAQCMEYLEENFSHSPAILFRDLPAKTAGDFSRIAQAIPDKGMLYEGGSGFRVQVSKDVGIYTASDDPSDYTIEMHNELTYSNVFPSKDVEQRAKLQGNSFRWDPTGDLHLWQKRPAFIPHPVSGEKIWFNIATGHHNSYHKASPTFIGADIPDKKFLFNTYYGDGSEIESEVIQHIRAASWACAVGFKW